MKSGSVLRLSEIDSTAVVSVGEMNHKVKLKLHSKEEEKEEKFRVRSKKWSESLTHLHVNQILCYGHNPKAQTLMNCAMRWSGRRWTCVSMLHCATCPCCVKIALCVNSLLRWGKGNPAQTFHGTESQRVSTTSETLTRTHMQTHRTSWNELNFNVKWTKTKQKTFGEALLRHLSISVMKSGLRARQWQKTDGIWTCKYLKDTAPNGAAHYAKQGQSLQNRGNNLCYILKCTYSNSRNIWTSLLYWIKKKWQERKLKIAHEKCYLHGVGQWYK